MIWKIRYIKLVVKSMKVENTASSSGERLQYRKIRRLRAKPDSLLIFRTKKNRFCSCYLFWVISSLLFKKIYFIDYAITVVPFLPPFSPPPCTPPPTHILPLQFMSMGRTYMFVLFIFTYKFFSFSIFYPILNLPLSIFYLPFMLLILCTFPPSLLLPLPC